MKKICIILGTRPELIKMAPVIRYCEQKSLPFFVIHTGQHYSYEMDEIFFKELELPKAKYNLGIGSASHGQQTGKMLIEIEKILLEERPDAVLVQGDTNSVLAGALTAVKIGIPVGHVEAGLRSFDRTMPEEINRIISDHISDWLFAPTSQAQTYLTEEGVPTHKIVITGNTIVDSVNQSLELSRQKSKVLEQNGLEAKDYFLLTVHRAENTDNEAVLRNIIEGVKKLIKKYSTTIIWPIHPRTKSRLESYGLMKGLEEISSLKIISPVGFLDFLQLEDNAKLAITDSGGVQEETCIMGTPCVTLRENTERPETVVVGANVIAGTSPDNILAATEIMLAKDVAWGNPYGDGLSGQRIVESILKKSLIFRKNSGANKDRILN